MERIAPTIDPSTVLEITDPDLNRLLQPGQFYSHPRDVVADMSLDLHEKRAILSSWVSDACAVESMPALRRAPGMPDPVAFDDIMDALRSLDGLSCADSGEERKAEPATHRLDA